MNHEEPQDMEMLPEYDFSGGGRGKYAERYAGGCNVVMSSSWRPTLPKRSRAPRLSTTRCWLW